jgi:prevent-host-death family protein
MPGTAEIRRHLSRFLKRVKAGERIVITDRGEPIAEVIPFRSGKGATAVSARIAYLASRGTVSVPRRALRSPRRLEKPSGRSQTPAADAITADRDDRQ